MKPKALLATLPLTAMLTALWLAARFAPARPLAVNSPTASATPTADQRQASVLISPLSAHSPLGVPSPVRPPPQPTATPRMPPTPVLATPRVPVAPTVTASPRPTWPVIVPPLATPTRFPDGSFTPQPTRLAPADLLPPGAQLIAATVASIGGQGEAAAVLAYRWPIGPDFNELRACSDLHAKVVPLRGATFVLSPDLPAGLRELRAANLQGDGLQEVILRPRWDGALRFTHDGLAAWPQIIGGSISFYGGALASAADGALYFNSLRPTLYYAGPKQATFADVDGDGRWEVDVAYSLEDGATVWQVDRYRWQNATYRYAETYTRPAADPLAPDRYRALLQALEPRPIFPPFGKGQLAVRSIQIQAQQMVQADADGDGQVETLLAYLIHPFYGEMMWDRFPNGRLGLAVFGADDALRVRFPEESLELLDSLKVAMQPVTLASDQPGLLFYRERTLQGSGAFWNDDLVLYRWEAGV